MASKMVKMATQTPWNVLFTFSPSAEVPHSEQNLEKTTQHAVDFHDEYNRAEPIFQNLDLDAICASGRITWSQESNKTILSFCAREMVSDKNRATPAQMVELMRRLGAPAHHLIPYEAYVELVKKTLSAIATRTAKIAATFVDDQGVCQWYEWSNRWCDEKTWDGDTKLPEGLHGDETAWHLRPAVPKRHDMGHIKLARATVALMGEQAAKSPPAAQVVTAFADPTTAISVSDPTIATSVAEPTTACELLPKPSTPPPSPKADTQTDVQLGDNRPGEVPVAAPVPRPTTPRQLPPKPNTPPAPIRESPLAVYASRRSTPSPIRESPLAVYASRRSTPSNLADFEAFYSSKKDFEPTKDLGPAFALIPSQHVDPSFPSRYQTPTWLWKAKPSPLRPFSSGIPALERFEQQQQQLECDESLKQYAREKNPNTVVGSTHQVVKKKKKPAAVVEKEKEKEKDEDGDEGGKWAKQKETQRTSFGEWFDDVFDEVEV